MVSRRIEISLTEMPHFRRLIEFMESVERYARLYADDELEEIVESARDDLLGMSSATAQDDAAA